MTIYNTANLNIDKKYKEVLDYFLSLCDDYENYLEEYILDIRHLSRPDSNTHGFNDYRIINFDDVYAIQVAAISCMIEVIENDYESRKMPKYIDKLYDAFKAIELLELDDEDLIINFN